MASYASSIGACLPRLRDFRLYLPNATFGNPETWDASGFRVLIARLSPFADVERSATHLFLAAEVRAAVPDGFVDMAFLPCAQDIAVLEGAGVPLLVGTQSHHSLEEFDLVLVSNSWVLEQVNLPWLLGRSGVPLRASSRDEQWPPIVLGGSNATAAHALVSETGDCIADAVFFGEGEGTVGRMVQLFRESRGLPKRDRIARAAREVPGLWPSGNLAAGVRKTRATLDDLSRAALLSGPILPGPEAGTTRLSISRGCPCLCSFCYEGFDRKPYRELPATALLEAARRIRISTGADTLEVDSFNFNTHSEIETLLVGLHRLFRHVNLMSQRVDILGGAPGLLDLEIAAGKASYTLGIEGISAPLRAFLHKSLPTADIRRVLEALHRRRTREIKLFYMLTGREESGDFEEFAAFARELKDIRDRGESLPRVVFSFGMLVRMPFTPLRYDAPVLDESAWKPIAGRARSICETNGFEFRLAMTWPEYAATQVLALAGHSVHGLLLRLAEEGPVTDAGLGAGAIGITEGWRATHRQEIEGEKGPDHVFGFPFLDDGKTRQMLYRQFQRAKEGRDTGYPRAAPSISGAELPALMESKRRLHPLYARVQVPREAAGLGARWGEACLLRALLGRLPSQIDNVLAVSESLVETTQILSPEIPWFGTTVAAITAWDTSRLSAGLGGDAMPGHDPKAPRTVRLRLSLPAASFPDPTGRLAAWLRDHHAPVTVTREGPVFRFIVPEKTSKKRMLLAGTSAKGGDATLLDLVVGSKPFIGEWLSSDSFEKGALRRALAEIYAVV